MNKNLEMYLEMERKKKIYKADMQKKLQDDHRKEGEKLRATILELFAVKKA